MCVFQYNVPLVFLPVHKSHIDYLLITFILFCHNIKAPHIAAGNNLDIPILRYTGVMMSTIDSQTDMFIYDTCMHALYSLSTLIRKLGGFFIRRKLDETSDGKKDVLYRSLLHAVSPQRYQIYLCV